MSLASCEHQFYYYSILGCLGEIRVGGLLLPYFAHSEIYKDQLSYRAHFSLNSTKPEEGCVLCFQQDCKNGGQCMNHETDYKCNCTLGYEKDDCSQNIDECLHSVCENNSTCIDGIGKYDCHCLAGYEGLKCESEINECLSRPCHNNGNCTDLIDDYLCDCVDDYTGKQCDILKLVTCENKPCRIGSTCVDGFSEYFIKRFFVYFFNTIFLDSTTGNNFTCLCSTGLQGAFCDIAFCTPEPCKNQGQCITDEMVPECRCPGYTGKFCEIEINECASLPCMNGGQCEDLKGDYKCICEGYSGKNCEFDIDECVTKQINCGGRGLCKNTAGSYK